MLKMKPMNKNINKTIVRIAKLIHNIRDWSMKKPKVLIVYILTDFISGC